MNLSDSEILELAALCGALEDGTLDPASQARLEHWLRESAAARDYYIRAMALSASLIAYASEMQTDSPANEFASSAAAVKPSEPLSPTRPRQAGGVWSVRVGLALALAMLGWWMTGHFGDPLPISHTDTLAVVARLTASKNCQWGQLGLGEVGSHLRAGQQVELLQGMAELTFASGAKVILTAPTTFASVSAWEGELARGTVRVAVPPNAAGFRVRSAAVEVIDLGTEFSLVADLEGAAEIFVHHGAVEVFPTDESDSLVLRADEARRFAPAGAEPVENQAEKLARFALPMDLERLVESTPYVRWGFDEVDGPIGFAEVVDTNMGDADFRLDHKTALPLRRSPGKWGQALPLEGIASGWALLSGLSLPRPKTVAFWVKFPEGASPLGPPALLAWGVKPKRWGGPSVLIGCNRNPAHGPLGALRVESGLDIDVGTSALRDGRWHHVAVVFVSTTNRWQVTSYVDARLEELARYPAKRKRSAANSLAADLGDEGRRDRLWLGRRPANATRPYENMQGLLDELYIIERELQPAEISRLMAENLLP